MAAPVKLTSLIIDNGKLIWIIINSLQKQFKEKYVKKREKIQLSYFDNIMKRQPFI